MKNKTLALIVLISLGVFIVFGAIAGAGYAYMVNKHGYIDYTITGDLLEYVSETQCALDGIDTVDIETVSTDVAFSKATDGLDADLRVSKFSSLKNLSLKTEVSEGLCTSKLYILPSPFIPETAVSIFRCPKILAATLSSILLQEISKAKFQAV